MGCGTIFMSSFIGLIFFNIPGAIIGAFIGFILNSRSSNNGTFYYENNQQSSSQNAGSNQLLFYKYLYGMLAKLAQADGAVTREEINIVDSFTEHELNLPDGVKQEVIRLFDQAKKNNTSFESYARNFYRMIGNQPNVLARVMELMNQLAAANGGTASQQSELLEKAVNIFGLNRSYNRQQRSTGSNNSFSQNGKDPYEILDCSREDSTKEIKKKYRKLVKEYHPDKIISKDLPDEFVELANKRFKEIQDAYEKIMKMRGEK